MNDEVLAKFGTARTCYSTSSAPLMAKVNPIVRRSNSWVSKDLVSKRLVVTNGLPPGNVCRKAGKPSKGRGTRRLRALLARSIIIRWEINASMLVCIDELAIAAERK